MGMRQWSRPRRVAHRPLRVYGVTSQREPCSALRRARLRGCDRGTGPKRVATGLMRVFAVRSPEGPLFRATTRLAKVLYLKLRREGLAFIHPVHSSAPDATRVARLDQSFPRKMMLVLRRPMRALGIRVEGDDGGRAEADAANRQIREPDWRASSLRPIDSSAVAQSTRGLPPDDAKRRS